MSRLILIVCFLITAHVLTGCSGNPTGFHTDSISVQVKENGIDVFNKVNRPVYYFAVERGTAAFINWAPISNDENEIKPRSNKFIPFSDIFGFEKGKEILFYYWKTDDPSLNDIQFLIIQTEE